MMDIVTVDEPTLAPNAPAPWWSSRDSVTLWHGTSSALLDRIFEEGLVPPPADLTAYANGLCQSFVGMGLEELPKKVRKYIEEYCLSQRRGVPGTSIIGSGLYFFPHPAIHRAARYAGYAKDGGEIAYSVRRVLERWRKKEISQIYPDADPVVLRVDVPISMCSPRGDESLTAKSERLRTAWKNRTERPFGYLKKHTPLKTWMTETSEFEIVIEGPISPDQIVAAYAVTGKIKVGKIKIDSQPLVIPRSTFVMAP